MDRENFLVDECTKHRHSLANNVGDGRCRENQPLGIRNFNL
jgi:hypothetical protein